MIMQPGPELDAKVAEALGAKLALSQLWPVVPHRLVFPDGSSVHHDDKLPWRPSTDLNAAFEAAEKCGLFAFLDTKNCRDFSHALTKCSRGWYFCRYDETIGEGHVEYVVAGPCDTPALAICAAILALTPRSSASSGSPSS